MASPLDLKTLEAAATWYVQLNDGEADEARTHAWQAWLQACPQHAAAWGRVEALQQQWTRMPARAALCGLGAAQKQRREVLKILGILMAVGSCSWVAVEQVPYRAVLAQQRTGTRERRSLRLDDGTQLELNADTALDIHFDANQRLIRLYAGEILVKTAKDPARRPFIVTSGDGIITALGTQFSVRQFDDHTLVGVLESAVEIRPRRQSGHTLRLETGQQVAFDRDAIQSPYALASGSTAWVRGMLSVDDWRLGDFITELSRYRPGVLRCAPAVQGLSISGAFRIDDTDTVLENLGKSLPVKVRYVTRYWATVEPT